MIIKPTDPAYIRHAAGVIRSKQGDNALTFAIAQLSDDRKLEGVNLEEFWLAIIRYLFSEEPGPPISESDQEFVSKPLEMRASHKNSH